MPRPRKPTLTLVPGSPAPPFHGVTAANYRELGNKFIKATYDPETDSCTTFLICKEPRKIKGEEFPATPLQWEAWLSFFQRKRIDHHGMFERGYYTVPCEWPSSFCAD